MRKIPSLILASVLCWIAPPAMANFAECIIEKMPGVANPAARSAIMRSCYQKYPAGLLEIERGSGRGMFGFKDQDACIIKKAKDTPFQPAASAIAYACACLYKKPQFEGEMCDYPKVP